MAEQSDGWTESTGCAGDGDEQPKSLVVDDDDELEHPGDGTVRRKHHTK